MAKLLNYPEAAAMNTKKLHTEDCGKRIVNERVHNFLMFLETEVNEDKNLVRRTEMKIGTKK